MPIDYKNYPPNWKSHIRPAVLRRANHRCESCGVPNYALGYRDELGGFHIVEGVGRGQVIRGVKGFCEGFKVIKIVLTVSHKDHDPQNNDPANLQALCQRCHLHYDRGHHARSRRINRRQREMARGQLSMF